MTHLGGIVSGGVNPAHQAAHAGAGDVGDGDVMLFQPGNHTDVGQSKRSTALQHQSNLVVVPELLGVLGHAKS